MSEQPSEGAAAVEGALPANSAGAALRAARERQGVRIEALAASLKVTRAQLERLEADRHDALPGAAFTRALALSVCRALKIDPEPVLAQIPRGAADDLSSVAMGLNEPFRERGEHGGRSDGAVWDGAINLQTGAALALVLAAAAVYWLPSGWWPRWERGDTAGTVTASAPSRALLPGDGAPAAAPSMGQAPATATNGPEAPAGNGALGATGAPGAPAATATGTAPPAAASDVAIDTVFSAPAAPPVPGDGPVAGGLLMLRAAAESWVEVRDGGGRILLSRSLAAGEAAGLDGALPLRLVIGNAEATEVTFRGQRVSLGGTKDNVARLELK